MCNVCMSSMSRFGNAIVVSANQGAVNQLNSDRLFTIVLYVFCMTVFVVYLNLSLAVLLPWLLQAHGSVSMTGLGVRI